MLDDLNARKTHKCDLCIRNITTKTNNKNKNNSKNIHKHKKVISIEVRITKNQYILIHIMYNKFSRCSLIMLQNGYLTYLITI